MSAAATESVAASARGAEIRIPLDTITCRTCLHKEHSSHTSQSKYGTVPYRVRIFRYSRN